MEKGGKNIRAEKSTEMWVTRAALRTVLEKNMTSCEGCKKPITYRSKMGSNQVIVNQYADGVWVEPVLAYHESCYKEQGEPFGAAEATPAMTGLRSLQELVTASALDESSEGYIANASEDQ